MKFIHREHIPCDVITETISLYPMRRSRVENNNISWSLDVPVNRYTALYQLFNGRPPGIFKIFNAIFLAQIV